MATGLRAGPGVCAVLLAGLYAVQRWERGAVATMKAASPLRKGAYQEVLLQAFPRLSSVRFGSFCVIFSVQPRIYSIRLNIFSLCFQESRSGETNSCVEEIIRVRVLIYKYYRLVGHRFQVGGGMWLHC